ncbi:CRN domain containing hypothetical protein-containing protein [Phytophthora palmivora]|uniref:Crinkler (CRN) family protein n=1 Tax=Phytophthora palmivora TaxID=4796 RepID=A0A2P4YVC8_9STRA|nr:CRN domain containing hypothetical protein-containing protein [Phytophthora palmivora]
MIKRKWFDLVDENSKALTSVDCVTLPNDAMSVDFRDDLKEKFKDSYLAGITASELTVFGNRTTYYAKQKLSRSSSSVIEFGSDEDNSLVVQTPQRIDSQLHYFIVPEVCEHVKTSVFQLPKQTQISEWVAFSKTLAVASDNILTDEYTLESLIPIRMTEGLGTFKLFPSRLFVHEQKAR